MHGYWLLHGGVWTIIHKYKQNCYRVYRHIKYYANTDSGQTKQGPDLGSGYGTIEGGQAGVSCRLWRLGRSGERKRKEEGEQGNRAEAQSRAGFPVRRAAVEEGRLRTLI